MLIIKEDISRSYDIGQIFIQLIDYAPGLPDCNKLGYWCDKEHLRYFVVRLASLYTTKELEEILNCKITKL